MRQKPNAPCAFLRENNDVFFFYFQDLFSALMMQCSVITGNTLCPDFQGNWQGEDTLWRREVAWASEVWLFGCICTSLTAPLYVFLFVFIFCFSTLVPKKFGPQQTSHLSVGCPESVRPGSTLTGSLVEELQSYGAQSTNKVIFFWASAFSALSKMYIV